MTISADIYEVALLVIAIAIIILVAAVVPAILQLKRTIKAVEELTIESKRTVEGINTIVRTIEGHTEDVGELVKGVKDVGLKATGLANAVVDGVRSPIISFISFLFGAEEGFKRFFKRDPKGGGSDGTD